MSLTLMSRMEDPSAGSTTRQAGPGHGQPHPWRTKWPAWLHRTPGMPQSVRLEARCHEAGTTGTRPPVRRQDRTLAAEHRQTYRSATTGWQLFDVFLRLP